MLSSDLFTSLPVSVEGGNPSSCLGTSCTSELVFALRAGGFDLRARPGPHASPRDAAQDTITTQEPSPPGQSTLSQSSGRRCRPVADVLDLLYRRPARHRTLRCAPTFACSTDSPCSRPSKPSPDHHLFDPSTLAWNRHSDLSPSYVLASNGSRARWPGSKLTLLSPCHRSPLSPNPRRLLSSPQHPSFGTRIFFLQLCQLSLDCVITPFSCHDRHLSHRRPHRCVA